MSLKVLITIIFIVKFDQNSGFLTNFGFEFLTKFRISDQISRFWPNFDWSSDRLVNRSWRAAGEQTGSAKAPSRGTRRRQGRRPFAESAALDQSVGCREVTLQLGL